MWENSEWTKLIKPRCENHIKLDLEYVGCEDED
jgi:hypothetical protein